MCRSSASAILCSSSVDHALIRETPGAPRYLLACSWLPQMLECEGFPGRPHVDTLRMNDQLLQLLRVAVERREVRSVDRSPVTEQEWRV